MDAKAEETRVNTRVDTLVRISKEAGSISGQKKLDAELLFNFRIVPLRLAILSTSVNLP